MEFVANIREAFTNLLSSKLRSFLAILGILVGTASVVAMVSCGQLATEAALAQFKALGTNLLSIAIYDDQGGGNNAKQFSIDDALKLKESSTEISLIAPYSSLYLPLNFAGNILNGSIIGATDVLQPAVKINMIQGRFISFLDQYAFFCVIGNNIYTQLQQYSRESVIGKQLHVGNYIFTIIGVTGTWQQNSFFNEDINNAIIIPFSTSQVISKYSTIRNIILRLTEKADIDQVQDLITQYISTNLPDKKLFVRSAKQIIQSMQNQQRIYTILLGLIGSISLLVGGIGVMNIMLVSVVERRREIGIRMAVGARRKDIRLLFLVESVSLSLFGGFIGVLLGIMTSFIIAHFAHWHFRVYFIPPMVGFWVSVATGVFFGYYPAYQASQLDPIQALRSD